MNEPLYRARYINLATFKADGTAVNTPVWCAWEDDAGYVFSAGDAGKVGRIRGSNRARVAPCGALGGLQGEWCEAEARLLETEEEQQRAHAALRRKYGGWMAVGDCFARLSGRDKRRAWIALRLRRDAEDDSGPAS